MGWLGGISRCLRLQQVMLVVLKIFCLILLQNNLLSSLFFCFDPEIIARHVLLEIKVIMGGGGIID